MTAWRELPDEGRRLFSPIGLLMRDDLTGRAPIGRVAAALDLQDGTDWHRTAVRAVFTRGGVIAYPGLGRGRDPASQPVRRYRVRVDADHYVARYPLSPDGYEFDAPPWDDTTPPATPPLGPVPLALVPGPTYPFPGHLLVLRGAVVDALGHPVPGAEVSRGSTARASADARGVFAIGLPQQGPGNLQLDATDPRTALAGSATVTLPLGLVRHVQIVIP